MHMEKPDPIVRRKLSDEVLDRLKSMIASGELSPGDEMPSERELMARFQVGRPAVREAMQALAGMGLVAISRSGTFGAVDHPPGRQHCQDHARLVR